MGLYRRPVYTSPRLTVEFEMDRGGIRKVAKGPELRAAVGLIAAKGKAYAESIAPHGRTGRYASSFEISFARITIAGMRRVAARLVNTHPQARAIEWGTKHTPAHHTLTKTLAYLSGRPGTGAGFEERGQLHSRDDDGNLQPGLIGRAPAGGLQPIPSFDNFRHAQDLNRQIRDARRRNRRRRGGRSDDDGSGPGR